ncbi:MAG: acetate--CoA ligase family protein [Gammaproteobacteria bacterium]|nr:acetate--CoA ligase family protein [Gammaproteobacteria bacterium]
MSSPLSRLLRPHSIAVLGGRWAHNVVEQCVTLGFTGDLWPLHPEHREVAGQSCYRRLADLPAAPDAVFIGVNRFATLDVVAELAAMGAGGAVCFASGFDEAAAEDEQGPELQRQLLLAAGDMPVIGPNCYGFINYLDGALLWPDQHGGVRTERGVALITQSSNIAINLTMQTRGLPVAYVLTAGNQAQQSLGELATAVLADERVTALGLHIEGFGDLDTFELMAATARELNKPVVVIKAGSSEVARQAMISHTNSLTGSDAAASAYLRRLGIARVTTVSELLETLKLLHSGGPLTGTDLQSMSCSGGEASLMADAAVTAKVNFPPLSQTQRHDLREALGPLVALANPLDYHTFIWGDLAAMTATFSAMLKRNADLSLLVLDFPRGDRCEYPDWELAIEALKQASANTGARIGILASLPENLPESIATKLLRDGVVPLCGIDDACVAIEAAAFIGTSHPGPPPLRLHSPASARTSGGMSHRTVDATTARRLLAEYRIPQPHSLAVSDKTELEHRITELDYPVVLKGQGIAHKTEAGAVVLDINTASDLLNAAGRMAENPALTGFEVEAMISGAVAELLISIVRDDVHGFVLTLAAGGVMTELLADATQLLIPVTEADIVAALTELKIHSVLEGYRGSAPANAAAITGIVMQLQQLALDFREHILELEINPLICRADDAVVVDILLSVSEDFQLREPTGDTPYE